MKKYCALSFDDGPNTDTTPLVLDILKKHSTVASFFICAKHINPQTEQVMKSAVSQGCEIQNHSVTHSVMPELTDDEIKAEIAFTNSEIARIAGREPEFFRPPYISVDDRMYRLISQTFIAGIGCEDWNEDVSAEERAERILSQIKDGDIILLHDMQGNIKTVKALDILIPELKKRGFEPITVSNLFRINGTKTIPHEKIIYSNVIR